MIHSHFIDEQQRFSIRKYSFGAASVLLGLMLVYPNQVSAEQQEKSIADATSINMPVVSKVKLGMGEEKGEKVETPSRDDHSVVSSGLDLSSSEQNMVLTESQVASHSVAASESTYTEMSTSSVPSETIKDSESNFNNSPKTVVSSLNSSIHSASQAAYVTKEENSPDLPKQGIYIYPERTDIRNAPKMSNPVQFYVNKGDKVFYDNLITQDGINWLTYISYSGIRRYAPIGKSDLRRSEKELSVSHNNQKSFPKLSNSGTYRFTKEVMVKNTPKISAKTEFTFNKGESINYDKTVVADNVQWLSYVSYSGKRRYVALSKVNDNLAETTKSKQKPSPIKQDSSKEGMKVIAKSGTHTFAKDRPIKNSPDVSAKTVLIYRKGNKVNYDCYLENDGHQWLSYISFSGVRRYVDMGDKRHKQDTSKSEPKKGVSDTPRELRTASGKLVFSNINSDGFTVTVMKVISPKPIKAIKVPVWSHKDGQDDLIWYTAQKMPDNTYQVKVETKNHKSDTRDYNVHLYYDYGDGQLKAITSDTVSVPTKSIPKPNVSDSLSSVSKKAVFNGFYYSVAGKYGDVIIVNKKHPLSEQYNPGENPTAKAAFVRLRDDMISKGHNVGYGYSGFRSYHTQQNLYQSYVNRDGKASADRYSARPGYSEHQTGLAYDLTDKSGRLLEDPAACRWLSNHAHEYGFIVRYQQGKEAITGFMKESWHIRYVGQEAKEIHNSGLSLEEYYGFQGGDYAGIKPSTGTNKMNLPSHGTYTFKKRASVKSEPNLSSPELAYYNAGSSVNYDSVITSSGHQWLSYISFSGFRRYIAVDI